MNQTAVANKTVLRKVREGVFVHDETGVSVMRGGDSQLRVFVVNRFGNPQYVSEAGVDMKMARRVAATYIGKVRDEVGRAHAEALHFDATLDDFVPMERPSIAATYRKWLDRGLPSHTWAAWLRRYNEMYGNAARPVDHTHIGNCAPHCRRWGSSEHEARAEFYGKSEDEMDRFYDEMCGSTA